MATAEKVTSTPLPSPPTQKLTSPLTGGKAKPLKAPKKEKKELDEEELAYREKQKAGACFYSGYSLRTWAVAGL